MKKLLISIIFIILTINNTYAKDLDSIVVTAKSQSLAIDTAGSFSIVTKKDIEKMNATSIQEVLEELVGISVGVNNASIGGRKSISIRGADSKHVLILIDGKRVSGTDAQIGHSDFQYNWLPLNAIKRIEVIRGPMSSLYGSSAIGGVVNIITQKPSDKTTAEVDVRFGKSSDDGGDIKDISLLVGGKISKNLSGSLFLQKEDIDITKNAQNPTFTADIEGKDITNGMLNLWYDIDDTQQLLFSGIFGKEIREYIVRVPNKTIYYDKYYDIDKIHYAFSYFKSFDDIYLDLKYYTTELEAHSAQYSKSHNLDNDVINAEISIDKIANNFIVVGVEKRVDKYTQDYDDPTKKDFKGEIDYLSGYFQDEIILNPKIVLNLGIRYDKHEKFGGELSPKAGLVYKLNENNRLKIAYGHGFNAPTVTQNSSNYKFFGPHNFFGNDDLKPETSDSYEVGYEYQKDLDIFKITAFKTDIKDMIHYLPIKREGRKITFLYSNVKKANLKGVEIEYEKRQILTNIDLNIGYHYLKTKDDEGNEIIAKPKHKANLRINTKLLYGIDSTLRVRYTGSQLDKVDGKFIKLKGYTTAGLQFSKRYENFIFRIGVENLTDKKLGSEYFFNNKGRLIYFGVKYRY